MAQDDTLSVTGGNRLGYTVVLLQVTDQYTDFFGTVRPGAGRNHRHGEI